MERLVLAPKILRERLERLYACLNRPEYITPDPLQFLGAYSRLEDREIAGMIASALAFGQVTQIVRNVGLVLDAFPEPRRDIERLSTRDFARRLAGFRHRYVGEAEIIDLLRGIRRVLRSEGSLGACFRRLSGGEDETVIPGLIHFVEELRRGSTLRRNYLLPSPTSGSACKRWQLYLRWMVRRDAVDPGGWDFIALSRLVVPLDTHLYRIARALGLTQRSAADLRTALEVTAAFRALTPEDPVRYDFALTRLGIRRDTDATAFLAELSEMEYAAPRK